MYRLNPQHWQQNRLSYTKNATPVLVPGLDEATAAGYVRVYDNGAAAYLVFYGKQSRPAVHYSAKSPAKATEAVLKHLHEAHARALRVAADKAAKKAQPKQAYHEGNRGGIPVRSYNTAQTAELIRQALKAEFPGIKFSVRSETFAGGSAVDVRWTDGPTAKDVEAVTDRFEMGTFDGMTDSYNYFGDSVLVDESGPYYASYGAKYIHQRRDYSAAYGEHCRAFDLRAAPALVAQVAAYHEHVQRQYRHDSISQHWSTETGNILLSQAHFPEQLAAFARNLEAQGVEVEQDQEDGRYYLAIYLKNSAAIAAA